MKKSNLRAVLGNLIRKALSLRMGEGRAILWLAAYFTLAMNISFWAYVVDSVEITGARVLAAVAMLPVLMFLLHYVVLSLLLFPYTLKPVAIFLLLVSSGANFFMFKYKVYIDTDMVRNVIDTNPGEAFDLITPWLVLWILIGGLIPSIMVWRVRVSYRPLLKLFAARVARIFGAFALIALVLFVNYKPYAFFARNNNEARKLANPENYIYALPKYFYNRRLANMKFELIDPEARHEPSGKARNIIVFVLGETARAENFSLNGYARDTNPELARRDVISFADVASAGTATATSVPVMFSHKTRGYSVDKLARMENVVDLIKQAGYSVRWLENDGGCKGVCDRVDYTNIKPDDPKWCDGTTCYDEVMLEGLEEYIAKGEGDMFVALHTIGSHGPSYFKRYPKEFQKFGPTCETAELQDCPRENIVNTYDNTIVYTDHFLGRVIDILGKIKGARASMIYASDHGESLGENGIYLHGMPYAIAPEQQRKVPMILWMNAEQRRRIDYECLKKRKPEAISHEYLFHSILSLGEVRSKLYDSELDLFGPCVK